MVEKDHPGTVCYLASSHQGVQEHEPRSRVAFRRPIMVYAYPPHLAPHHVIKLPAILGY